MSDSPQPIATLHRKGKFDRSTSIVQAIIVAVVQIVLVPPLLDSSTCKSNFIITLMNFIILCIYVYYHTWPILNFSLIAYSLMKLCLIKVAKANVYIGPFSINPVTYVGGLRTTYCLLFVVKTFHVFCRLLHNRESFLANICM